jgi:hypothetical protein
LRINVLLVATAAAHATAGITPRGIGDALTAGIKCLLYAACGKYAVTTRSRQLGDTHCQVDIL